jgi:hypothetical protein
MDDVLRVADAEIVGVAIERDSTVVHLKDWREVDVHVRFQDAIGVECFGFAGQDLSHVTWSAEHPSIARALAIGQESSDDAASFRCMSFSLPVRMSRS